MKKNHVKEWALKNGYRYCPIGDAEKETGIIIYTDYLGPYPPESVYKEHEKIKRYCKRVGLRCASSPMHTGIRIFYKEPIFD